MPWLWGWSSPSQTQATYITTVSSTFCISRSRQQPLFLIVLSGSPPGASAGDVRSTSKVLRNKKATSRCRHPSFPWSYPIRSREFGNPFPVPLPTRIGFHSVIQKTNNNKSTGRPVNEAPLPFLQCDCFSNQGGVFLVAVCPEGLCEAKHNHDASVGKASSTGHFGENIIS